MNNKLLHKSLPNGVEDMLPINVFFADAKENKPKIIEGFMYVESDFYNTTKMNCRPFYKPAFL